MVCFFDALRDTVKKDAKAPKGPHGATLGKHAPTNPVKIQTYPEMTLCDTLEKFFTVRPERRNRCVKSQTISGS